MHPRLAEVTAYLDRTRAALEETVAGLTLDEAARRPSPEAWSPAEVVDHLSRVEHRIVGLLSKLVARGADEGLGPEDSTESVLGRLDRYQLENAQLRRVEASARSRPSPDAELGRALAALREVRAELHGLLRAADGMALSRLKAPSPVLGEMDFYEWVLFLTKHEERHRRQIVATVERIRAGAPGTPPGPPPSA